MREIGAGAFQECDLLVSIALPEGIDAIGEGAFRQCAALETVDLPDGLTEIAPFTFWGCKKLENISLPDGLVSIGEEAFAYCASLSAVSLPEGLARIGDFAFSGCNSLKAISLPAGLRHVGINPFFACAALETFSVPPEHPCFFADGGVLYEKAARTLVAYPASRAGRAFAVPEGVAAIGSGAFAGCATLASVSLPEGLASIGDLAFYECEAPGGRRGAGGSNSRRNGVCRLHLVGIGNVARQPGFFGRVSLFGLFFAAEHRFACGIGIHWQRRISRVRARLHRFAAGAFVD